jgi:hypothetical protein
MMTPSAMSRMLITPVLREANGRHLTTPCGSGVLAERLKLRGLWQNTVDSVHSVHSDHRITTRQRTQKPFAPDAWPVRLVGWTCTGAGMSAIRTRQAIQIRGHLSALRGLRAIGC